MQNLMISPSNGDYVLSASGSSIPSDDVKIAAYIALQIPQNRWLYGNPNQGSQLYTLNNVKRTGSTEQQIAGMVSDALERQLVSTNQAQAFNFKNLQATRTATLDQIAIVPAVTEISNQFNFTAV